MVNNDLSKEDQKELFKILKLRFEKNRPENSALDLAESIGVKMLDEREYRGLQALGNFNMKTSSWIQTPEPIRDLGRALFCEFRYDTVFVYHNGAESYYQ